MNVVSRIALLALVATLTGCYHYVPQAGRSLAQGTPLRIRLRTPQSFELSSLTANNIGVVTAEMIREEPGDVVVSTLWLEAVTGDGFSGENWTFPIPRANIASLDVRTFSAWRTGVIVVGGFLATYMGFDALRGSAGGTGQPGGGGQPR
ncbi:MAG TPA: hypothetical protein VLA36_02725 [Longimicrobiales bacterium]|nr:hypothetical protein [Longimicrobiales bacterium]